MLITSPLLFDTRPRPALLPPPSFSALPHNPAQEQTAAVGERRPFGCQGVEMESVTLRHVPARATIRLRSWTARISRKIDHAMPRQLPLISICIKYLDSIGLRGAALPPACSSIKMCVWQKDEKMLIALTKENKQRVLKPIDGGRECNGQYVFWNRALVSCKPFEIDWRVTCP
ncbi:MAG: hypothetical protein LBB76_09860 [Azoarcus sp.]|jgi:hypothetical protein|nr:hypothetical protein [Azoarcus sp.]